MKTREKGRGGDLIQEQGLEAEERPGKKEWQREQEEQVEVEAEAEED